jgi:hypothetical protein
MRRQAMYVCRLLVRALEAEGDKRLYQVRQMRLAVDDLKIMIQLAKEIKAFKSFQLSQVVSELVVLTGKQGGAWCRQLTQRIAPGHPGQPSYPSHPGSHASHPKSTSCGAHVHPSAPASQARMS